MLRGRRFEPGAHGAALQSVQTLILLTSREEHDWSKCGFQQSQRSDKRGGDRSFNSILECQIVELARGYGRITVRFSFGDG